MGQEDNFRVFFNIIRFKAETKIFRQFIDRKTLANLRRRILEDIDVCRSEGLVFCNELRPITFACLVCPCRCRVSYDTVDENNHSLSALLLLKVSRVRESWRHRQRGKQANHKRSGDSTCNHLQSPQKEVAWRTLKSTR